MEGEAREIGIRKRKAGEKTVPDFENVDFGKFDALLAGFLVILFDEIVEDGYERCFREAFQGKKIAEDGFSIKGIAPGGGNQKSAVEIEG